MIRLATLLVCLACEAHKFHFSRAEIDYYAPRLEVVVTMHAEDLPVTVESEVKLCAYVAAHFEIEGVKLKCLGAKSTVHFVDVFLEGASDRPPRRMRNQILLREFADQRNAVMLRREAKPVGKAVEFCAGDVWKGLDW